jgi:ABC-type multidrug transport system ATPase subunit
VVAVQGLELEVHPGETVALVGPNGSGKTTTLKALLGLVRPSAGRVLVDGHDVATAGVPARRLLGYLPQRLSFPEGMTGREAMRLYAKLRQAAAAEIAPLLERVGLTDAADRTTDGYSGGMRQRLGLAVALLGSPAALVLDEPSAALDPTGALLVRDLIREIAADGTTVLISSHDLAEVAALADRVGVFVAGELRAIGTVAELSGHADGAEGVEEIYRRLTRPLMKVA